MLATAMPDSSPPAPAVGVDLGGTTVKIALVSPELEILGRTSAPTDRRSQDTLLDQLSRMIEEFVEDRAVAGVGFGLPSQIDQRRGLVLDSTNVPLEDLDFAGEMNSRLGLEIRIDNDANVACLAEARCGVAQGVRHMVMLTLGTGVGGGLLLDGSLYRGAIGSGGELGHMSIDEDGPPCQGLCYNRGCLEVLASATGVMSAANTLANEQPSGRLANAREGGTELDARFIIDRAEAGDREAREVLRRVGRHLGVGIANYVNIFNPELVVVGGGVSSAGDLLLEPAREECRRRALKATGEEVRIVAAQLGNDAGLIGAAALVFE
jgi:glucokinase